MSVERMQYESLGGKRKARVEALPDDDRVDNPSVAGAYVARLEAGDPAARAMRTILARADYRLGKDDGYHRARVTSGTTLLRLVQRDEAAVARVFPVAVAMATHGPIVGWQLRALMAVEALLEVTSDSLARPWWRQRAVNLGMDGWRVAIERAGGTYGARPVVMAALVLLAALEPEGRRT